MINNNNNNNNNNINNNINNIELKILSQYKKMHIYCKKCKKHTANTFPKKIILISKNKIKGKSKCAICLTKRTFINETEADLEIGLEIYLQVFTN